MASKSSKKVSESDPPPQQLWFFLMEDMKDSGFKQSDYSLTEVKKMDLKLQQCLELSGVQGQAQDYSFWIHSQSMKSAVQMLTDESIIGTYNLYCSEDSIVQIIIRQANDPSPNTSRAPSHAASLASRQHKSARRGLLAPELFIQPKVRHVSGSTDMETFEEIVDETNMVSIAVAGETFTFTRDYLKGWIDSQLLNLKLPTDVVVQSVAPDGQAHNVRLTADVWQSHLIRGPWKSYFAGVQDTFVRAQAKREEMIADIQSANVTFTKCCTDFIYDLRHFGQSDKSRKRLESTGNQYYIGLPYFSDHVRDQILRLPVQVGTLQTALDHLAEKRLGSTICASHDLSPLYESALGLSWDKAKGKASVVPGQSKRSGLTFRAKELIKHGSLMLKKKSKRGGI